MFPFLMSLGLSLITSNLPRSFGIKLQKSSVFLWKSSGEHRRSSDDLSEISGQLRKSSKDHVRKLAKFSKNFKGNFGKFRTSRIIESRKFSGVFGYDLMYNSNSLFSLQYNPTCMADHQSWSLEVEQSSSVSVGLTGVASAVKYPPSYKLCHHVDCCMWSW